MNTAWVIFEIFRVLNAKGWKSSYTKCWDPSDRNLNAVQKRNAVTRRSAMHCQSEGTGERTLVGLEAGAGHAIAFTSGSATTATVLQSLGPNAHILSVNDIYGGTSPGLQRKPGVPR
ncbi:hypothetical protein BD769DRAFT_1383599 [Suillus cothurnatus]|nr:hypothetical protein BD769DRAFT_1383599 [Suillus cothurnatus]